MIQFLDLKSTNKDLVEEINIAINSVIESGRYIGGDALTNFEENFSRYVKAKNCIGVGNGLDALRISLLALGIGRGDEVIVPSHTFIATWLAVSAVGAKIIPVSPDPNTYNIDLKKIEDAITPRTKAIIPVHLYGRPCDIVGINQIADRNNIKVIEDAAQAHGASYHNKTIGSNGNICCWSFYPGKNLGALGDAGAITTDDSAIANTMRQISNYGSKEKYTHDLQGINSRLDPLHAAVLNVKLKYLDRWNKCRRSIANQYLNNISNSSICLPPNDDVVKSSWHLFVVRSKYREDLSSYLLSKNIQTIIHYPIPPFKQLCYVGDFKDFSCDLTSQICNEILSLPIGPHLEHSEIQYVIETINRFNN